jgi:hypothetical protein
MPDDAASTRTARRLKSAFGALYGTLMQEAPERAAWEALAFETLDACIKRARARVGEAGHSLGFKTLLKQELDEVCALTPAVMPFEAQTAAGQGREVRKIVWAEDRKARDRERAANLRRNEMLAQLREVVTSTRDD